MHNYPEKWSNLDVTLCHDWLTGMRGGERVLEILCDGFPAAAIRTLIHNRQSVSDTINTHPIQTSPLQHLPGIFQSYRNFLPLFPAMLRSLAPASGDLLISTSHCVAKSMRSAPRTPHLCYCFTPMRYAWLFEREYFGNNAAKALVIKPVLSMLRRWDRKTADRVTHFVAISEHVRERVQKFYGREADVVFPPVDTGRLTPLPGKPTKSFDLIVSALVPYKRIDLAVEAYRKLGSPLKIVGVGGEFSRLKAGAPENVSFLGWQKDEDILDLYRNCRMLVFPGQEDFGLVPLEAQACGSPVVAYARGGALETVKNGETGVLFDHQTPDSLADAVERCAAQDWNRERIRTHAERFGIEAFITGMDAMIAKCMQLGGQG